MIKIPFRNRNTVIPKYYKNLINEINELEKNFRELTDIELRTKNFQFFSEYKKTKNLDNLITRSFAITREASFRTLGLRHFDVQVMAGLVLNNNQIAEMKTGEGKTLVATLPASLNALSKKGVHIVTINDYLANRDQVSMGQIFRFLGFDTGLIQSRMTPDQRKYNYKSDITYVTNYELTFDYLRDNTELSQNNIVLPPFNYCIVDEVDSILIDEAQTPIILASINEKESAEKYIFASEIIKYLKLNIHYQVDEKNKNVTLTDLGSRQVEQIVQTQSLFDEKNPWIPYISNALRAKTLFFNNIHYIIQNNRIVIVDQFTGRIMPDRTWGDGLHQALEAKEKIPIRPQAETEASITYQNFFLMYPKLSGMTGTGKTSEIEFSKIYKLTVETIPTNKLIKRKDLPDLVYKDQFCKWNAIAEFCNQVSLTGQPILVGTTTVEKSEMLAQLLNEYKLSYQLLNAKPENVRRESTIVAQAGKKKSITIATNMAGRGTDIILGGNVNFTIQKELYYILVLAKSELLLVRSKKVLRKNLQSIKLFNKSKYKIRSILNDFEWSFNEVTKLHKFFQIKLFLHFKTLIIYQKNKQCKSENIQLIKKLKHVTKNCSKKFLNILTKFIKISKFLKLSDIDILRILQENDRIAMPTISYQCSIRFLLNDLRFSIQKQYNQENQIVKNLGGLCVIGTERNDSRRIDDQLRGRCGRQGDPGLSRFFISLDDNLLRLFGGEKIQKLIGNGMLDDLPIESTFLSKSLNNAQRKVEERAYEQRKNLFEYDEVLNQQRSIIYFERRSLLIKYSVQSTILNYGEQVISKLVNKLKRKTITLMYMSKIFETLFAYKINLKFFNDIEFNSDNYDENELFIYFFQEFWLAYQDKVDQFSVYGNGLNAFRNFERQISLLNFNIIWKEQLEKANLLRDAVSWRSYGQKNPLTEYKIEAYASFQKRKESFIYYTLYQIFHVNII